VALLREFEDRMSRSVECELFSLFCAREHPLEGEAPRAPHLTNARHVANDCSEVCDANLAQPIDERMSFRKAWSTHSAGSRAMQAAFGHRHGTTPKVLWSGVAGSARSISTSAAQAAARAHRRMRDGMRLER